MSLPSNLRLAFIGGGHIARALIGGLHRRGCTNIVVAEHDAERRAALQRDFAVTVGESLDGEPADITVIAVRPAQVQAACAALTDARLIISVAAGVRLRSLSAWAGGHQRLIRVMPNTPAQRGFGMSVCCAAAATTAADKEQTAAIFDAVGAVAWLEDEALLDAATALSGSGPAYIYYFIDAMQQAGKRLGLPAAVAELAALQTARGALEMLGEGDKSAAQLCDAVAVAGGTTERALSVFKQHALSAVVDEAMAAAAERAKNIGDEFEQ